MKTRKKRATFRSGTTSAMKRVGFVVGRRAMPFTVQPGTYWGAKTLTVSPEAERAVFEAACEKQV